VGHLKQSALVWLSRLSPVQEGLLFGLILAGTIGAYGAFGPVIPIGRGFGWDGVVYGKLATDFFGFLEKPGLSPERASRVLPSFVVWAALGVVRLQRTDPVVRGAFVALNALLMGGAAVVFNATMVRLGLSRAARGIGLTGLSVSFMGLVMPAYYAPLTDTCGLFLSCLGLYGFVARQTATLTITSAVAALSWPTASYASVLLAGFGPPAGPGWASPDFARKASSAAAGCAFVAVAVAGALAAWKGYTPTLYYSNATPRLDAALPLSILVAAIYVAFGTRALVRAALLAPRPRPALQALGPAIVLVILTLGASTLVSQPGKGFLEMMFVGGDNIFGRGTVAPGVFLVAHATYFGPLVVLATFYRDRMAKVAADLGFGAVLTLMAGLLLSLTSESRHLIAFWPLFVLLVAACVPSNISWTWVVAFLALSIAWSKIWLVPHTFDAGKPSVVRYFAHQGPWMIREAYILQGIAMVLTWLILIRVTATISRKA
jgi:hypothetical protein